MIVVAAAKVLSTIIASIGAPYSHRYGWLRVMSPRLRGLASNDTLLFRQRIQSDWPAEFLGLALLPAFVHGLRHFQMVLQSRKGLPRPIFELWVVTAVSVPLEQRYRVLMSAHLHGVVL